MPRISNLPTEYDECKAFIQWSEYTPIVKKYLFHIPNEGLRNPITGKRLKYIGMRKGVSDYFLPFPANGKHGLWLEMKRKYSKATLEQTSWLREMHGLGYEAHLVNGADEAILAVKKYLLMI